MRSRSWKGRRRDGGEVGQASVEFVAALPALALVLLVAFQLALTGYVLWSAGVAARAGARAAHVGSDAERVARRTLPGRLRRDSKVTEDGAVSVRVLVPALIPGLPRIPVEARAALDPSGNG